MRILSFYVPDPLPGVEVHPAFFFLHPPAATGLFQAGVPQSYFATAPLVPVAQAAAIVLPNNFKRTDERIDAYVRRHADLAEQHSLPLFVFACGDFTEHLSFDPRAQVFRYSLYRAAMRPQDICMPTVTEDLGADGIAIRPKQEQPVVSFCGKAGFPTLRSRIAYYAKILVADLHSIVRPGAAAQKVGIYWRRRAIRACRRSSAVATNFIIRSSFSGSRRTIELDPAQARKEFIDSVVESDFVLAPKGDGNYSNRFLEALSLGRIPVLIDTDVLLPLEDEITYDRCVVRVSMQEVDRLPEIVRGWYDAHSEDEWEAVQRYARGTYATALRQNAFFDTFFRTKLNQPDRQLHVRQ